MADAAAFSSIDAEHVVAYLRVSTSEQSTDSQRIALRALADKHGWDPDAITWLEDTVSGTTSSRPGLDQLELGVRDGRFKLLLVYKLDRLARSMRHLVNLLEMLESNEATLLCVDGLGSTDSPWSRALLYVAAAFAEVERELIQERVKAGLVAARERGVKLGAPKKEFDLGLVQTLRDEGWTLGRIASALEVSERTLYRRLQTTDEPHDHSEPTDVGQVTQSPAIPAACAALPVARRVGPGDKASDIDRAAKVEAAALALVEAGLGAGADLAYIADVIGRTGASKEELLALHRDCRIHLVEAERPDDLPRDKLRASTIEFRKTRFVFVQPHPALF